MSNLDDYLGFSGLPDELEASGYMLPEEPIFDDVPTEKEVEVALKQNPMTVPIDDVIEEEVKPSKVLKKVEEVEKEVSILTTDELLSLTVLIPKSKYGEALRLLGGLHG